MTENSYELLSPPMTVRPAGAGLGHAGQGVVDDEDIARRSGHLPREQLVQMRVRVRIHVGSRPGEDRQDSHPSGDRMVAGSILNRPRPASPFTVGHLNPSGLFTDFESVTEGR
jgi:hypothetical protein